MRAPGFWWREPGAASTILAPFAALYGTVADRRLAIRGASAGIPVICIGNLTLGGGGKTPTALAVARLLAASGERPFFLTRGYGGRITGPILVDPAIHGFADVGDEALLLARAFPTVVAHDRLAGARFARAQGASAVVMDDGFQNARLVKDYALIAVDGARGIGNGCVFPAGPMRAGLDAQLAQAHGLIAIGAGEGLKTAKAMATRHDLPLFAGWLEPDPAALATLREGRFLAFAGIAHPEKFFATLDAFGIAAPVRQSFADHHAYTSAEVDALLRAADAQGLTPITTEKDFVRLSVHPALQAHARVLPVTLAIEDESRLVAAILAAIRKTSGSGSDPGNGAPAPPPARHRPPDDRRSNI